MSLSVKLTDWQRYQKWAIRRTILSKRRTNHRQVITCTSPSNQTSILRVYCTVHDQYTSHFLSSS